jgi:hypothetical protein
MNIGMTPESRKANQWSSQESELAQEKVLSRQEPIHTKEAKNGYNSLPKAVLTPQEYKNKHIMTTRAKGKLGGEGTEASNGEEPREKERKRSREIARDSGTEGSREAESQEKDEREESSGVREEPVARPAPIAKTAPRIAEDKSIRAQLPPRPMPPQSTIPRYQNRSQVEKREKVDELMEMVLGSKIEDITFEHVLAASGEMRVKLMNLLRPHKIEVMQLAQEAGENLIVSHQVVPLRELPVIVNGKHPINAVLDSGSSIITVREDLWREIGELPINPQDSIQMQTADANQSATKGSLEKLRIEIGDLEFFVWAQVVTNSPCKMLLGKPFYALMRTKTETYPDGFTVLTLTDPNDTAKIRTVSTKTRGAQEAMASESMMRDADKEEERAEEIEYDEVMIPSFVYEIPNFEDESPF